LPLFSSPGPGATSFLMYFLPEEIPGKKDGTGILFAAHRTYQLKKKRWGQVFYLPDTQHAN
jgi:hypothetical protein